MKRAPREQDDAPSASEQLLFGGRLRLDMPWNRHGDAVMQLGLRAMVKQLPHLLALAARLAHRADGRALRLVLGAELGRGAAQAAGMVAVNGVLAALLTTGSTQQRLAAAGPALLVVAVTAILGAMLRAVSTMGTGRLEPKIERVATEIYLQSAAKVELAAIEDPDFHRRMESARYGAASARRMVQYSTAVINALLSLAASIGVLTVLHPALLPLLVTMTLPSAWATLTIARRRYVSFQQWTQHARAGRLISDLLTSTQAAAEIRLHGIAAFLLEHYRSMSRQSEAEQERLAQLAARTGLIASAGTGLAAASTFGVLGLLLWTGAMALSVGGTAVIAIRTGTSSLDGLVRQVNYLNEEALFVRDLEHIQNEAERRAIPAAGRPLPERIDAIRFENVTFTYPGKDAGPALREVSLTIPAGKTVALVGHNGSGKSTIAKLLAGLYIPAHGRILVGGVATSDVDRTALFGRIATVAQDYHYWPFTARINVAIGRVQALQATPFPHERLAQALRRGDAEKVIEQCPRGGDTLLARGYEGGHNLSGGQWQKLGIARAYFRQAEILVVDEPTAALDAGAEQRAFAQIRELAAEGQTVVLITHRLHSVRHADLIHVLDQGRLAESGTFEELMNPAVTPSGIFRGDFEIQRSQYQEGQGLPSQKDGAQPCEDVR
ncbi:MULTISPECIES: ABC transporter ATP-binding protein [Streptomyces]|uniref:ABC transporter ATP-binding protein n=1 Tax=Streptomyces TaxID=1883 RepID=UPI0004CD68B4|nr:MULTISPECIES: ABC transporter ATP-binding protein [Streptomyces]KOT48397.1 ABC transporter [Streptomyces rimosus subsp. rimosus]